MTNELHKDKDFVLAKMNRRTALTTTIIGAVVTLMAVLIPLGISNSNAAKTEDQKSVLESKEEDKPTDTPTPTATPTEEQKGKGKKD